MKKQLIILDRDGVINLDSKDYIKSPDEWHVIPGSLEAIAKLNHHGYKVAVATNQSGVARGYFDQHVLKTIHDKMRAELAEVGGHIDALFYCHHHPDDGCACRKPRPGLLIKLQEFFDVPSNSTLMIGDSLKDLQAAEQAGCDAYLVRTGNGLTTEQQVAPGSYPVFTDLAEAVGSLV